MSPPSSASSNSYLPCDLSASSYDLERPPLVKKISPTAYAIYLPPRPPPERLPDVPEDIFSDAPLHPTQQIALESLKEAFDGSAGHRAHFDPTMRGSPPPSPPPLIGVTPPLRIRKRAPNALGLSVKLMTVTARNDHNSSLRPPDIIADEYFAPRYVRFQKAGGSHAATETAWLPPPPLPRVALNGLPPLPPEHEARTVPVPYCMRRQASSRLVRRQASQEEARMTAFPASRPSSEPLTPGSLDMVDRPQSIDEAEGFDSMHRSLPERRPRTALQGDRLGARTHRAKEEYTKRDPLLGVTPRDAAAVSHSESRRFPAVQPESPSFSMPITLVNRPPGYGQATTVRPHLPGSSDTRQYLAKSEENPNHSPLSASQSYRHPPTPHGVSSSAINLFGHARRNSDGSSGEVASPRLHTRKPSFTAAHGILSPPRLPALAQKLKSPFKHSPPPPPPNTSSKAAALLGVDAPEPPMTLSRLIGRQRHVKLADDDALYCLPGNGPPGRRERTGYSGSAVNGVTPHRNVDAYIDEHGRKWRVDPDSESDDDWFRQEQEARVLRRLPERAREVAAIRKHDAEAKYKYSSPDGHIAAPLPPLICDAGRHDRRSRDDGGDVPKQSSSSSSLCNGSEQDSPQLRTMTPPPAPTSPRSHPRCSDDYTHPFAVARPRPIHASPIHLTRIRTPPSPIRPITFHTPPTLHSSPTRTPSILSHRSRTSSDLEALQPSTPTLPDDPFALHPGYGNAHPQSLGGSSSSPLIANPSQVVKPRAYTLKPKQSPSGGMVLVDLEDNIPNLTPETTHREYAGPGTLLGARHVPAPLALADDAGQSWFEHDPITPTPHGHGLKKFVRSIKG